ncbi:MAG: hypothetical protein R3C68_14540, partial [Myxococcota bacterium]
MSILFTAVLLLSGTSTDATEESKSTESHHQAAQGIPLPGDLRLNGRFDLNYERVGFSGDPSEGQQALRNYHHFIFLSRQAKGDPVTFNAELIDLTFYEAAYKMTIAQSVRLKIKAGKILVPFGAEPLFHNSYGGRSGFDQQILPIIWARHGASAQLQYRLGSVALSNDLYAVQGHALRTADGVLNLQNDFSANDDVNFGTGDRLGVSWGPISAWYSFYFNRLGFDRKLFLQALDISVWRPRSIPVLEDFSLSAGILRADISGGGAGEDYYHFGDYLQVRYYPWDWFYLQYRTGLRTTNNRRGIVFDNTRGDENDNSSHNFAVVVQ